MNVIETKPQSESHSLLNKIPPVIFGTSGLGNLFKAMDDGVKLEIVKEAVRHSDKPVVFDSAGKYGAGLALETLGKCLKQLDVAPADVIISNKLGWYRTELKTAEPTFEPGVWKDLKYDAVQLISYDGIIKCFEQGNELLNGYIPQLVSVHDPDEYLANAKSASEDKALYNDILEAYRALADLKVECKVQSIGVGAKNWKAIERISKDVKLDWVMIANSMTIKNHPEDLTAFMEGLQQQGIKIINSAVFHAGFLIGGDHYDYKLIKPDTEANKAIFKWREDFFALCKSHGVLLAEACVQFALRAPGVVSIALNTTSPNRVKDNVDMANVDIPESFWHDMKAKGLIRLDYKYV
jgi:D-threo-aldose 1-dehydrogenase